MIGFVGATARAAHRKEWGSWIDSMWMMMLLVRGSSPR